MVINVNFNVIHSSNLNENFLFDDLLDYECVSTRHEKNVVVHGHQEIICVNVEDTDAIILVDFQIKSNMIYFKYLQ
jgi:hypothetical protein